MIAVVNKACYFKNIKSKIMWKRISNSEIINLMTPQYLKQDGIYGYLFESNNHVYWIYVSDNIPICNNVTQYFENVCDE